MKLSDLWRLCVSFPRALLRDDRLASNAGRDADCMARLRLENFESASADWLWETSPTGELLYLSPKVADVIARPLDQMLGKRLSDVSGLPAHIGPWQSLQCLMSERREVLATEVPVRISGEKRWWLLTGKPHTSPSGVFSGYRGVGRDVTGQHMAKAALLQAKQEAQRALEAKSQFLNVLSHELRTPLNAIIGFSEIMAAEREGPLGNGSYSSYSRSIVESSRQLQRIINDIIDASRIESASFRLHEQEVDAAELAQVTLRNSRQLAADSNVALTGDYHAVRAEIRGDLARLKQILENLLTNAIKFTPASGTVHLLLRDEPDGGLVFLIRDTGIGIQKQDLERIFEPFVQVDVGMSRKFGGTGLGLPIARKLASAHGGTISLESTPGIGTTVTFWLPADRVMRDVPSQTIAGDTAAA